jgi:soluble lytic murein transglycosylase
MRRLFAFILFLLPSAAHAAAEPSFAQSCVQRYATHYRVPPELVSAFIDVESGWNPKALSNKGAMGLMQLMPATAKRFGALQPFDEEQHIAAGTRYITSLMWEFHGDLRLVAAAYFAGDRWVGVKQLNYQNHDAIEYVRAIRRRYEMRRYAAGRPPRR